MHCRQSPRLLANPCLMSDVKHGASALWVRQECMEGDAFSGAQM